MADWQVEVTGVRETFLVVRRHRGRWPQQDLARNDADRIIWFEDREAAQAHADRLNGKTEASET